MKRNFIGMAVSLLLLSTAHAQGGGGEKTGSLSKSNVVPAGYYIELSRCNACAGLHWQRNTEAAFRARGLSAFPGNPKYDDSYQSIQFLERLRRVSDKLTSVYVGPFQTRNAASVAASQIPSILRKQIAEDQGSSVPSSTGMFEVKIVRVRSAVATGGIDSFLADAYLIRPGYGIGKVMIGSARSDVEAVLGQPRYRSTNSDTWQSGDESLVVLYSGGVVRQLEVSSPRFHTTSGLTATSGQQRFLQAFPKLSKQCCGIYGASGFSEWTCWDAVSKGIALRRGSHSGGSSLNALIIHAAGQPAMQSEYGDAECKPCR